MQNKIKINIFIFGIIFFVILGGECNGMAENKPWPWASVPEIVFNETKSFSISGPSGWMFFYPNEDDIILSKDGPYIQVIGLKKSPYKDAFKRIKKDISDKILTTELMELFLADMHSANPHINLNVIHKSPAVIDGKDCFRIQLEYAGPSDVIFNEVLYGFIDNGYYYRIYYFAPKLYYFERDLPTFEGIVKSFKRIISPA